MGQNLCCLRHPESAQKRTQRPSSGANDHNEAANPTPHQHKPAIVEGGRVTTLGEMISNSPILDRHSLCQRNETMKRVLYHTSPDFNNVFYTPRISFSSGKLEKIEELSGDGEEGKELCRMSRSGRDKEEQKKKKKKKKVTFMLPEEAPADHVVLVYSPIR